MTSYFEIGGHVVVVDTPTPSSSQSGVTVAKRPERGRNLAKAESVRSPLRANDTGESQAYLGVNDIARLNRVRVALTVAVTLAAADGPLPIGDTLALAGLLIYSGWELGHHFDIL